VWSCRARGWAIEARQAHGLAGRQAARYADEQPGRHADGKPGRQTGGQRGRQAGGPPSEPCARAASWPRKTARAAMNVPTILWNTQVPVMSGLGNVQGRLAYNSSEFVIAAFLKLPNVEWGAAFLVNAFIGLFVLVALFEHLYASLRTAGRITLASVYAFVLLAAWCANYFNRRAVRRGQNRGTASPVSRRAAERRLGIPAATVLFGRKSAVRRGSGGHAPGRRLRLGLAGRTPGRRLRRGPAGCARGGRLRRAAGAGPQGADAPLASRPQGLPISRRRVGGEFAQPGAVRALLRAWPASGGMWRWSARDAGASRARWRCLD
jgi:hypothetical protein